MKPIFFIFSLFISSITVAQDFSFLEEGNEKQSVSESSYSFTWLTNLEEAQKQSKATNKPILVYFTGSDWCAPCVALKADFFESADFQPYISDFILVMIDYPRRVDIVSKDQLAYNKKVIAKYNKSKTFPKVMILDKNGREKDKLSGYSSYNGYKDTSHHYNLVKKHAQRS